MYQLPPNAGQPQQMENPQVKRALSKQQTLNASLKEPGLSNIQRGL